jgi:hypothetical protein
MNTTKCWTVEVFVDEHEDQRTVSAHARLDTNDDLHVHGFGTAQLDPLDAGRPQTGDQLAVARALSEVAHKIAARAHEERAEVRMGPWVS